MVNSKDNPLGLSPGQVDEINQIMNIIKESGSDFAYPSTSLYVESMPKD